MMLKEKSSPWVRLKYLCVLSLAVIAVTAFARPEISNKMEEISVVKVNDLAAIVETKVQETVPKVVNDTVKITGNIVKVVGWKNTFESPEKLEAKQIDRGEPKVTRIGVKLDEKDRPLIIVDGKEVDHSQVSTLNPERILNISVLSDKSSTRIYSRKGRRNGVIVFTMMTEEEFQEKMKRKNSDEQASDRVKIASMEIMAEQDGMDSKKDGDGNNGIINVSTKKKCTTKAGDNELKVTGKVQDKDGTPIVGAAVVIKGTNQGTIVDADGTFRLVAPKDAVLSISYIGLQTAEVKVSSTPLIVTLKEE